MGVAGREADGRTSPEELLAAAHSSCYAMAFSHALATAGTPPERLHVTAVVSLNPKEGGGVEVTDSALTVTGVVPGLDQAGFQAAAEEGEQGCPISNAIRGNVAITVTATLDGSPLPAAFLATPASKRARSTTKRWCAPCADAVAPSCGLRAKASGGPRPPPAGRAPPPPAPAGVAASWLRSTWTPSDSSPSSRWGAMSVDAGPLDQAHHEAGGEDLRHRREPGATRGRGGARSCSTGTMKPQLVLQAGARGSASPAPPVHAGRAEEAERLVAERP